MLYKPHTQILHCSSYHLGFFQLLPPTIRGNSCCGGLPRQENGGRGDVGGWLCLKHHYLHFNVIDVRCAGSWLIAVSWLHPGLEAAITALAAILHVNDFNNDARRRLRFVAMKWWPNCTRSLKWKGDILNGGQFAQWWNEYMSIRW